MAIKFLNSVAVDTDVLFVDTANERVGIGTASPGAKLDVLVGGTNHIQLGASALGSTGDYIGGLYYSSNKLLMESFLVGTGYQDILLSPNGGNVGIGTTIPTEKLTIAGNNKILFTGVSPQNLPASIGTDSNDHLAITAGIGSGKKITIGITGRLFEIQGSNNKYQNDNHIFSNYAGVESMRIISNGNVGIGTTSPSGILSVSDGTYDTLRVNNGTSHLAGTRLYRLDSEVGSSTAWMLDATGNSIIVGPRTGTVQFSVVDASENVKFIVDNGNVGIGATSPTEKLHVDGNARVTGAYYDSGNTPGTVNQLLASTATGTAWIDPSTIVAEAATLVVIACKNTSGATIAQGTPVYQTGTVGATATIEIAPADALISANKLPAIGLLQTALNNNGFGNVVITGELTNFTTSPIDGVVPTTGDKVFVKSGGGLTLTKPTGEGNGIQNMGLVGKVSGGNAGSITVSSIMRTNDVPNLPEGRVWVGDGNTIVSDTVYIDEPNNRLGIGTTAPVVKLDVNSSGVAAFFKSSSNQVPVSIFSASTRSTIGFKGSTSTSEYHVRVGADNKDFVAYTNNTEKLRILENGNVGIGTTSPGTKLEIGGSSEPGIRLRETGGSNYYDIKTNGSIAWFGDQANGMKNLVVTAGGGAEIRTNGDLVAFKVENIAPAGSLYIKGTTGNVGIGTTSPIDKLSVRGSAGANSISVLDPTLDLRRASMGLDSLENGFIELRRDNNTVYTYITSSGNSYLNGGNVGIGTTSPGTKLDVAGNANISDALAIGSLSTVPTASLGRALNIQVLANSSGTTVAQWLDVDRTITTNSTSANTYGMLLRNASTTTSTANDGNIYGAQIIGRHQGTGGINSALGVRGTADINTTGTITTTGSLWGAYNEGQVTNGSVTFSNSGIYGTASIAQVLGSGTVNITTRGIVGVGSVGGINNVNATVNRVVAGEFELDLQNGTTEQAHVISLNTYNITSPTNLSIDEFAYIYLGEDVAIPTTITDNAYFIKSLTSLPSELAGSIEATSFIKTGGTSSQFLKADGSIDSTSYAPATGGSYLPLSAGASYPLTGVLYIGGTIRNNSGDLEIRNQTATGFATATKLKQQTVNGLETFLTLDGTTRYTTFEAGNVGIGETSPSSKLEVRAETATHKLVSLNRAASTTAAMYLGNDSSNNAIISSNYSDLIFGRDQSSTLSEWMRIKRDGNVGIGTTSPSYKLDVSGTGRFEDTLSVNGKTVILNNGTLTWGASSDYGQLSWDTGYALYRGQSGKGIKLQVNSSSTAMTLTTGGNVGIGTTTPGAKLDVNGDVFINSNYTGSNAAANDLTIGKTTTGNHGITIATGPTYTGSIYFGDSGNNDAGIIGYQHSNNSMKFTTNRSEKMRITSGGKVGIGTTNPGAKLEVKDTSNTGDGTKTLLGLYNSGGALGEDTALEIGHGSTRSAIIAAHKMGTGNNHDLSFSTNAVSAAATEKMRITSAGNVGIGVTTPRAKLDVAGGIKVADDTDPAGANKVGTLRYRTSGNNSYVDMCMQTGASTYEWINVVQNNW